ncbi:ClpP/crotonase-like domain-containing protein [Syncephalis plumigaleata]|nr:ClpP/crotonase-like domain-containing protein [Syncephalis plumigaleata]
MTTTTYHDIIYTVANGIATVVLNRPKRGNAITPRMRDELIVAFKQIATDSTVRAAVLTGAGPYFCTGMDLAQTSDMADDAGPAKDPVVSAIQMFDAIRHCSKPVVARIQGPALGGGVGLVFCTDIRVAVATTKSVDKQQNHRSKDVYFRLSEVERGLVPAVIARYIVPDLGPVRARQLMMTALPVTAVEAAREWPGFLTSVVDDVASLDAAIADFTNALRNNAPLAMADAKRLVAALGGGEAAVQGTSSESSDDDKAVGVVKQVFTRMLASEEAAYGIGEFLAKRRPNWDEYIATTQAKSKL